MSNEPRKEQSGVSIKTLLIAAVYVSLNVLADVLSVMITPKVRTGLR